MKGTYWIAVAAICFAGCSSCDDNNVAQNNANNANNGSNNGSNGSNNGSNNGGSNNGTNNPNSITNNAPTECTPAYEYDDWDVTQDRRLIKACSPYIIDTSVEVSEGALLLIDPGVEVQVDGGEWIRINEGRIEANGTEDDPILFTSADGSPAAGSWRGIRFSTEIENGNEISHATIEYGGLNEFGQEGCLVIDNGAGNDRLTLANITFRECEGSGLYSPGNPFAEISSLTFEEMDIGLSLGADAVGVVTEGFTYTNVGANEINNTDVTETATWVPQMIPYRVRSSIEVQGENDPTLRLEAGLRLQFNNSSWFRVGSSEDGGLVVAGTEAEPVVFESAAGTPSAGDWRGLRLETNALGGTEVSNLTIRHGGQDEFGTEGCLTIGTTAAGRISVDDSTFEECARSGVAASSEQFQFESFTGNTFRDMDIGLSLHPNAISSIGSQVYDATGANRVDPGTLTEAGTWVAQDIPWRVNGSIEVQGENAPVLTIEAGNTFQFSGGWLRVGSSDEGGLIVQGTAADPVVFQSSAAAPAAGDWRGIRFATRALNNTLLEYAVVEHGGLDEFGTNGCLTIEGSTQGRIAIRNSTFNECAISCLAAGGADFEFDEVSSNTFQNSQVGMRLHPNAIGQVIDGQIYDSVANNEIDGETLDNTSTWVSQSIPWLVTGSIEVQNANNAPVLTIETPNTFEFNPSTWLRVGSSDSGGLVVNGTAADPVVFTSPSANPGPGDWRGIRLLADTTNGTLLDYIVLEYAGQDEFGQNGGLHIADTGTSVTVSNSVFQNNLQTDIWIDADSTPTLTNNTGTVTNQ